MKTHGWLAWAAVMAVLPAGPGWANDVALVDGLPPHKLIHTEIGGGSDSSVSPDGRYLAFSSRRSGNLDIWTANIETGALRQITTDPATDNEPRWHPDGTHLCFVTMRNGSQDVYIVDLETLEETPIATEDHNEDYPSFRKDGTEICYTGGPRGYREVMVHNLETGEQRTLTRGYGYVGSTNFSPDGERIVFHAYYDNSYQSGKADVFTVSSRRGGGAPVNITNTRDIWDYKPNWSWDGNWITFSTKRGTPNFNIWVMRPDGSDLRAVTQVEGPVPYTSTGEISMSYANALDQRWSNWTKDGRVGWHQINPQQGSLKAYDIERGAVSEVYSSEFEINDMQLSPDGSKLLFENDGRIFVLAPGGEAVAIGNGVQPRWSTDGRLVSYLTRWRTQVMVVPAEGGEARTIEARPAEWPPAARNALSPDGKTLALLDRGEDGMSLKLVQEDGTETVVTGGAQSLSLPVWSADGSVVYFNENVPPSVSYFITLEPVEKMEY